MNLQEHAVIELTPAEMMETNGGIIGGLFAAVAGFLIGYNLVHWIYEYVW